MSFSEKLPSRVVAKKETRRILWPSETHLRACGRII
jgi:hypothetical protein